MLLQSLGLSEHPHFLTLASKWCILVHIKGDKNKIMCNGVLAKTWGPHWK